MVVTYPSLQGALTVLSDRDVLSCDTETSGLTWGDRLFAVIIADAEKEYYFPTELVPSLRPLFKDKKKTWVFKNAKFDMRMLHWEGIEIAGEIEDITFAARVLKNDLYGQKAYSLEALAKREGLEKLSIVEDYIKEHKLYEMRPYKLGGTYKQPQFDKVPLNIISEYGCMDARLTYDLRRTYLRRMDAEDEKIYKHECSLINTCFDMEMRGVRLDIKYTEEGMAYEKEQLQKKKRHFLQATGKEYQDSKGLLVPIFEAAGEQIPKTDKGNPSLTDDVLENFTSPVGKIVQGIRYSEKRISTYYTNYINGHDERGYIHPTMWIEGTRTGRFSYSNPNLQNIPKEESSEEKYVIRGCFAPTPGNIFVSLDYKQMEYRMMLAYAGERRLIQEVMNGADLHQATAELLRIQRSPAKTLNFAILYGAGIEQISRMLQVSLAEAARLRTKYFLGLPRVEAFISDVIGTGRTRGFVRNWYGRKLRSDSDFAYALPNHLIQGGCADVVKIAMRETAKIHPAVLQVHDQLLLDIHPSKVGLVDDIKRAMESVWSMNGMSLEVDIKWSDKSFAERDMYEWSEVVQRLGKVC